MEWNCKNCGACCVGMRVEVTHAEFSRVDSALAAQERLTMSTERYKRYLPVLEGSSCVALGGTVGTPDARCVIYENRPKICKDFRPGSHQCVTMRILHQVDTVDDVVQWFLIQEGRVPLELLNNVRDYYSAPGLSPHQGSLAATVESWIREALRLQDDSSPTRMSSAFNDEGARLAQLREAVGDADLKRFAVAEAE
jgi:Fe-S-cluster containining protein